MTTYSRHWSLLKMFFAIALSLRLHRSASFLHETRPLTFKRISTSIGKSLSFPDRSTSRQSSTDAADEEKQPSPQEEEKVSLYRSEGLFTVAKPLDWTCSNVVSYIRGMLEKDARNRGAEVSKIGRRNKSQQIRIGHGGTLDPLGA
jgi:hypothetical protein